MSDLESDMEFVPDKKGTDAPAPTDEDDSPVTLESACLAVARERARAERLSERAGELARFVARVSETMPRDSRIAAEARDVLRDGLYGATAEGAESSRAGLAGALRERDDTEKLVEILHKRGWTKHDNTVLMAKAPRRIVLISPPYQAAK